MTALKRIACPGKLRLGTIDGRRIAAPQRVFVETNPLGRASAKNHPANATVPEEKRFRHAIRGRNSLVAFHAAFPQMKEYLPVVLGLLFDDPSPLHLKLAGIHRFNGFDRGHDGHEGFWFRPLDRCRWQQSGQNRD